MLAGISGEMFCNQDETLGKPSNMNGKLAELRKLNTHIKELLKILVTVFCK